MLVGHTALYIVLWNIYQSRFLSRSVFWTPELCIYIYMYWTWKKWLPLFPSQIMLLWNMKKINFNIISIQKYVFIMVFILDVKSEHVAHAWRNMGHLGIKKNPICDCSRSNQMSYIGQITEIASYVRTYFWITI